MSPLIDALAAIPKAVVTAPKVVEVAAAVPKVAEVAKVATAPQALAGGLEAGLGTPHHTVEHLAKVNENLANFNSGSVPAGTELPPPSPGPTSPGAEVGPGTTPAALESPISPTTPLGAEKRPSAQQSTTGSTTESKKTANTDEVASVPTSEQRTLTPTESDELAGIMKATTDSELQIKNGTNDRMTDWDNNNPMPDPTTETAKFNDWTEQRADALSHSHLEASIDNAVAQWDKSNPMPDRTKDLDKFNEWTKKRAEIRDRVRSELDTGEANEKGAKQEQGESTAEIMKKVKRLKELNVLRGDLIQSIAILQERSLLDKDAKLQLTEYRLKKDQYDVEIQMLENQLTGQVAKAPLSKKLLIIAALAAAPILAAGAQAAKG